MSSRRQHKRERSDPPQPKHVWQVGDEAEAECHDDAPDYEDTLHPVRIISINSKKNTALVKMMAFDDEQPFELRNLLDLHPFRAPQPNHPYAVGDEVHFRMYRRKVRGQNVDGYAGDEEGIWVKGVVTKLVPGERYSICVSHLNWNADSKNGKSYISDWAVPRDVRLANY